MRVLSVQQPWAHLEVHGLRTTERRTFPHSCRERIAIHASAAAPWKEIQAAWDRDEQTARVFAEMGWRSRRSFRALVHSAIIGTVELRWVRRGGVPDVDEETARLETVAENDDKYRAARAGSRSAWRRRKLPPMPVAVPPDQYAWIFACPAPIEPIEGVKGQQHLWTLPEEIAREVAVREARTLRGQWKPPAPDSSERRTALAEWGRRWTRDAEVEATRLFAEAMWEIQVETLKFDPGTEAQFMRRLRQRIVQSTVNAPGQVPQALVEIKYRDLFGGRDRVSALEYEATLRTDMHDQLHRARHESRNEAIHKRMVYRLRQYRTWAAQFPATDDEIAADVKGIFRRMFASGVQDDQRNARRVSVEGP